MIEKPNEQDNLDDRRLSAKDPDTWTHADNKRSAQIQVKWELWFLHYGVDRALRDRAEASDAGRAASSA